MQVFPHRFGNRGLVFVVKRGFHAMTLRLFRFFEAMPDTKRPAANSLGAA
jgi:hypothetical protein